jgi:hypothetical protein
MPSDSFSDHGERRDARRARSTETLSAIGAGPGHDLPGGA